MLGIGREGPLGATAAAAWEAQDAGVPPDVNHAGAAAPAASPEHSEREALAVLTTVDGLGPSGLAALIERIGSARAVLEIASGPDAVRRLTNGRDGARTARPTTLEVAAAIADCAMRASAILDRIEAAGVTIVSLDDADYPARLRAIELPPHVLFVAGSIEALDGAHPVAVVGTRRPSETGRLVAARIGAALARCGAIVVSGLAVGIDGSAHAAVVAEGGVTVGVLGGGHARFFPPVHRRLADQILAKGGAIVSELAPDVEPTPGTFPRRNRIISGLSDATVVVEAGARSGALLTAGWALDQGRGCFIVPGSIDSPTSSGCLSYLREFHDEARIVTGIPQLIADLGLASVAEVQRRGAIADASVAAVLVELGGTAGRIAGELLAGHATVDELVAITDLPIATVLAALTILEDRGLVSGVYGRYRPIGGLAPMSPRRARRRPRPAVRPRAAPGRDQGSGRA